MRVGLVGCVKKKAETGRAAEDLYTSALFRGRRAYVEHSCDRWFILSALHGLVNPVAWLQPYDKSLDNVSRAERREWSARILKELAGQVGNLVLHSFEIHAGAPYRDFGLVSGLQAAGAIVETPGAGLSIGRLLAFYAAQDKGLAADRPRPLTPVPPSQQALGTAPLAKYLETATSPATLTFGEIEAILGTALPPSARTHRAWWANSKDRTLARQWLAVGWRADSVDLADGWVRLTR